MLTIYIFVVFFQELGINLDCITDDAFKTLAILKNLTEKNLEALEIFCEGEMLVWLKNKMKSRYN